MRGEWEPGGVIWDDESLDELQAMLDARKKAQRRPVPPLAPKPSGPQRKPDTIHMSAWFWRLSFVDRQPKRGRGPMLWRRYKPLFQKEAGRDPDLSDDYAIDLLNTLLKRSAARGY
jgi:hypothetical protein